MAWKHSSSVNPTSLTKACRCPMRLCMISLKRGELPPSKLASTASVSFSSARSRVPLAADPASCGSTSSPSLQLATSLYDKQRSDNRCAHRGESVSDLGGVSPTLREPCSSGAPFGHGPRTPTGVGVFEQLADTVLIYRARVVARRFFE